MDLDNIENLNEEQVLDLYQNVVEAGNNLISERCTKTGEVCRGGYWWEETYCERSGKSYFEYIVPCK